MQRVSTKRRKATDNAKHTTLGMPSKKAIFEILTYLDIKNDNPFVWIVV